MSTYNFQLVVTAAHVTASYAREVGVGAESILGVLVCKAYKDAVPLIIATAKDQTVGVYT